MLFEAQSKQQENVFNCLECVASKFPKDEQTWYPAQNTTTALHF